MISLCGAGMMVSDFTLCAGRTVSDFNLWGWYDGESFRSVSEAGMTVSDFTLWGWYDGD